MTRAPYKNQEEALPCFQFDAALKNIERAAEA
jgi:hypothetical protein